MKANILLNKNNEVIGYRKYPLDLTQPTIELEEFPKNLVVGEYKFENNKIVRKTVVNPTQVNRSISKYSKEKLLKAFIEYRNNVNYGLITEDEITHQKMVKWYKAVTDNDVSSINNPPKIILKYLEDNSWI